TIPDSEFDEFRHHRGATSYHPKMMLKIILYAYTQSDFLIILHLTELVNRQIKGYARKILVLSFDESH
uniref:hypothetical protein n=1 Tax=Staphylococcus aureus TaxID=1280 RepID=UPI000A79B6FA